MTQNEFHRAIVVVVVIWVVVMQEAAEVVATVTVSSQLHFCSHITRHYSMNGTKVAIGKIDVKKNSDVVTMY